MLSVALRSAWMLFSRHCCASSLQASSHPVIGVLDSALCNLKIKPFRSGSINLSMASPANLENKIDMSLMNTKYMRLFVDQNNVENFQRLDVRNCVSEEQDSILISFCFNRYFLLCLNSIFFWIHFQISIYNYLFSYIFSDEIHELPKWQIKLDLKIPNRNLLQGQIWFLRIFIPSNIQPLWRMD